MLLQWRLPLRFETHEDDLRRRRNTHHRKGYLQQCAARLGRAQIARQHVQIFKPKVDERYSADHLVSHSDMRIRSEVVSSAAEILEKLDCHAEVIGIAEVSSSM